jgi:hypothetical protein
MSKKKTSQKDETPPPPRRVVHKPLHEAIAKPLSELMAALAVERARNVALHVTSLPVAKRRAYVLYPMTETDEQSAMTFALHVGSIERAACLEIARTLVDSATAEKLANAFAERGHCKYELTVQFNEDTMSWTPRTELALAK